MSVTAQRFYCFNEDLGRKVHNLNADTLKFLLTNTAPALTNAVKSDITEISAGNGYTAGGHQMTGNTYAQTLGVAVLNGSNVVITASGGSIGPYRYAVLYNDTSATDALIGFIDYTVSNTLTAGQALTIDVTTSGTGVLSDG